MGYVYFHYVNLGIKGEDYIGKAEECVKKAFELDPESPKCHGLLGIFNQVFRGNQQQSVLHFKRALAVDEYDRDALLWLGLGYAAYTGKTFAAIPLVDRLLQIDPLFPFSVWLLGVTHFFEGRYDLALVHWQKTHQMLPDTPVSQFFYAIALAYNKCFEEAFTVINKSAETSPQHSYSQLGLFCMYAFQNNKTEALRYLSQELETWLKRDGWYSWHVTVSYALLDMKQEALDWLENAANQGFINYPFLNERDPFLENIRGEERFKKLMEKVKNEWEHFEV
jgi:tetratricopeptide (TPR) repeat protein